MGSQCFLQMDKRFTGVPIATKFRDEWRESRKSDTGGLENVGPVKKLRQFVLKITYTRGI